MTLMTNREFNQIVKYLNQIKKKYDVRYYATILSWDNKHEKEIRYVEVTVNSKRYRFGERYYGAGTCDKLIEIALTKKCIETMIWILENSEYGK